ncbi:MAG: tripartite tricarboxylate transporter permease [Thermodesulfobacteriota bacterium]|nr:tripartite tricarboxylate transporter permease [Thermodesulfobacteriota bacterium]
MDLVNGILSALTPVNLLYAFIGCFLGTLVGVLPGLGPASAVAIIFPFTSYLPPTGTVITLAAIYYGAMYGGSTTAILMNVPGEVASVVTALDGYQMTKQGRPGPALAIAAIVSFMAGIVGSFLIGFLGPPIARLALGFGPAEYLGLGLFSLTAVASLAGKSLVKGGIVTLAGMFLATVGVDVASSVPRLTFGSTLLLQGFTLIPVMIGLFGIGEVLSSLQEKISKPTTGVGHLMPSREELRKGLAAGARATAVSFPLGLIPGMLPPIATFLSYSLEKQYSKHPERFGKGAIEGVAAAEAANNAAAMGNLVPLLCLGVPAGPTMALMMAALIMYGIIPGPLLFTRHAHFVWTVIGSFFVANFILLILNLPLVGLWARITTIPYPILAPVILVLCAVGSYAMRGSMFDVWITIIFGLIGWAMNKKGWPMTPAVLAFIIGPMIENSGRQVLSISPTLLLDRPLFWGFLVAAIGVIWSSRHFLGRV